MHYHCDYNDTTTSDIGYFHDAMMKLILQGDVCRLSTVIRKVGHPIAFQTPFQYQFGIHSCGDLSMVN